MTLFLLLFSVLFFSVAFRYYGRFLARRFGLDDQRQPPSETERDGVDYVPTRASVVFGHHFSSIAGAGPIVGPILACMYFGWGPTWVWILLGAAFVGGVHDFGSGFLSMRSRGQSLAEIMRDLLGRRIGLIFAVFILLALLYVVIVFLDLTAETFTTTPAVTTASVWFIFVAVLFGYILRRIPGLSFRTLVLIFVPLTYLGLGIGYYFPANFGDKTFWIVMASVYSFIAAVLPVHMLLQPRDFLSATFLYAILAAGVIGMLFAHQPMVSPFFLEWHSEQHGSLIPILFITVACGACSGFHSMVASGTTSKQLKRESDLTRVNYGAMLVEGVLAVFAMCCFATLSSEEIAAAKQPVALFSHGAGKFLSIFGISPEVAAQFAMLAVSTFLLTTLDTCARLSRFLIEEILGKRNQATRYFGTLFVVGLAAGLSLQPINGVPVWKAIWPLFGSTNQLLAAIALIGVVLYLRREKIPYGFAAWPAVLMFTMPVASLFFLTSKHGAQSLIGVAAILQLALTALLVVAVIRTFRTRQLGQDSL
jgi:carbon starvation protein